MNNYPFLDFINEDKSKYTHAKDAGFVDDDDLFLIGDSGGFLMNIIKGATFINTERFCEVANYYKKNNGYYTKFKIDSIPHRQFRKREEYRRIHGFSAPCLRMPNGEIRNVRITGSHYNFLNYTRMEQLDETTIKRGKNNKANKHYDFPKFIDSQFWTYHSMEFAENNAYHFLIDKTRRGGFSYMMAADSSNAVNAQSRKVIIHVAADKKYLTMTGGLTNFAINNLKFYEERTPFVRGIFSPIKEDFKLGYKLPSGVEADKSWKSALISVSAMNNPDCAIGKDAKKIKVEEVSTMDNFDEFMEVTEPAMRTGAYTTGTLYAWGTATSGDMSSFERNFYNVKAYNFMPFENVWDKDSRHEVCGFFKPYIWGLQGEYNGIKSLDEDGNSNIAIALEICKLERLRKKEDCKTYSEYISYLGQYAITPSESFSNASENIFSSEELSLWEERLKTDSTLQFHVDGQLEKTASGIVEFKSNQRLVKEGKKIYNYIESFPRKQHEDPHGCVRIWFHPEYIEINNKRQIPEDLYCITYDPVGVNKDKKEITNKHSHNSISVWMKPHYTNGYKGKKVASYYGRPDKLEDADYICYLLAIYYNCIKNVHVEVNRGETVSNFKKWNALKYLAFEPLFIWDVNIKDKYSTTYGYSIAGGQRKLDCIRLLKEFLYDVIGVDENGKPIRNFHNIYDLVAINELKKWNDKGNFDRVSEMLLRGLSYKADNLKAESELSKRHELTEENLEENDILNREWFN